jgi:hypothetical protein
MFKWTLGLCGAVLLFPWLGVGFFALVHEKPGLFGLAAALSLALTVGGLLGVLPVRLCCELIRRIRGGQPLPHPYLIGGLAGLGTGILGAAALVLWFAVTRAGGEGPFILLILAPFVLGGSLAAGLLVGRGYHRRQRSGPVGPR